MVSLAIGPNLSMSSSVAENSHAKVKFSNCGVTTVHFCCFFVNFEQIRICFLWL